ncbi:hypothetical protein [Afipia felis]|uniref:Uncharacterized protein n=2 Tax=Afipia felis TaxID=1035 RepID=A0A380W3I1_AFIFE|nr:hypothetical protein [Afipia felis]EKS30278.1 hypothetical protein HMPREF9697_02806 [Afipia felis ATCC 53690]SUU75023.1 Uncharacterised protein [Afipia felis]SUU83089.1 Uncharacterised protein [Afipia felis]
MSALGHLAPLRDLEGENDQLRQLLIQAGVEAQAHDVAARLQAVNESNVLVDLNLPDYRLHDLATLP